ncbi:MAG: hypothetical protein NTY53_18215 [Kiritimatiellaeota bacterium]|nr:hypothetical protein [Kiritimatiellota bacterium]
MKKSLAVLMVVAVFAAGVVSAAEVAAPSHPGIGLTLKAGSTGAGGDLTLGLTENFNLRAGIGFFTWTQKGVGGSEGNDQKDVKLDLLNIPVTLDWHPITGNGFRISAGVMFNNDRGEISAKSGQNVSVNDNDYLVSSLSGKIDFNRFGPYLGIGYGNAADTSAHWHFATDLGVAYLGSPNITLEATALNPAQQAALNSDIAAQINKYQDDVKPFKFYPVLTIGVSYTF